LGAADGAAELDKPVDRRRWKISLHIVNAFAASGNQIIFPASILQPPFFNANANANADDASYQPLPGERINGRLTPGENLPPTRSPFGDVWWRLVNSLRPPPDRSPEDQRRKV